MLLDIGHVPTLTRPLAAYAVGCDPRTLRGWLESGTITLLAPREAAGTWLRLAPVDTVRLAVFGNVLRFGFTMAEAAAIVTRHVDPCVSGVLLAAGDITWNLLRNRVLGLVLTISREPDGRIAVSTDSLHRSRPVPHGGAMLTINVHAINEATHRRARERDSRHA